MSRKTKLTNEIYQIQNHIFVKNIKVKCNYYNITTRFNIYKILVVNFNDALLAELKGTQQPVNLTKIKER